MTTEGAVFLAACGVFIFGPVTLVLFGKAARWITFGAMSAFIIFAAEIWAACLILPWGVVSNPAMGPLFTLMGILAGSAGAGISLLLKPRESPYTKFIKIMERHDS